MDRFVDIWLLFSATWGSTKATSGKDGKSKKEKSSSHQKSSRVNGSGRSGRGHGESKSSHADNLREVGAQFTGLPPSYSKTNSGAILLTTVIYRWKMT